MQKLIAGVHKFQTQQFGKYRELFQRLADEGQNPHTLFITCSDSRVLAELITQSKPGDLFVVKNAGNIIPPATVKGSTNSTAGAIEFAVSALGVSDIVVCGHSQCGAMNALVNGLTEDNARVMPHLAAWLEIAAPVRKVIREKYGHITQPNDLATATAEENVLFGLENLQTYPEVRRRIEEGTLHLHAWFFHIATAHLFAYDPASTQFLPLAT